MKIVLIFALLFSMSAHADDSKIKVTSFRYVTEYPTRIAEICGEVLIPTTPDMRVAVKVDPGDQEGTYTILPPESGRWCQLVLTLSGHADVTLVDGKQSLSSTLVRVRK